MVDLRKTFAGDPKQYHVIVASGSAAYCYDEEDMKAYVAFQQKRGFECRVYELVEGV